MKKGMKNIFAILIMLGFSVWLIVWLYRYIIQLM
ncbi:Uncharacterised protein [Listeria fleischmannii subsp. coloradonensis]|nr:Uncharacterised protein [Listeria fleischmannii subsp. coloradonensis]